MSRQYKMPRKYNRMRASDHCENCGEKKLAEELRQRADESNIAITWHAPILCQKCYREKYGVDG
jgi:hypothetical protein